MRVVTVIPDAGPDGYIFAQRQVASLRELGVTIEPFFLSGRHSMTELLAERRRFRRLLDEFQPDLVHTHYGTITAFFSVTATRLPIVITFHGSDLNPVPSIPRWRSVVGHLLSQIAALRAGRILCVSEALRGRLWWRRDRVSIIPMGVDLRRFVPQPRDDARRELGWQPSERVVLFNAGTTPAVKRLDLAERAVQAATRLAGPIRFCVTDGSVPPDSMPTLINAADCLLITSDYEGSPTVVKEAMACNLPIVSVDAGDVRERLRGVEPSRIVERDPDRIGRALADVLASGARSNGRGAAAGLDSRAIARRVLAEFETLLAEPVTALRRRVA